jgi:DNA-binding protein HU-beta
MERGRFIMNKTELIAAVAEKTGLTKKDAERVVNATFETISQNLAAGNKVQISGFGNFEVKAREARVGRNPRTKETIEIPATRLPVFKASKALKDSVSK